MKFDASSLSVEGIATVALAVGLVSFYFFGGNLATKPEAKLRETAPQPPSLITGETGRKKKKGKNEPIPPIQQSDHPRLPGGNENFASSSPPKDPALLVASLEAGSAAQEHRGKVKKAKKKGRETAAKHERDDSTSSSVPPAPGPKTRSATKKATTPTQQTLPDPDGDGEWRVVGRSRRANTTADSQASFTTSSVTDAGSPKEENLPTSILNTPLPVEIENSSKEEHEASEPGAPTQIPSVETDDEVIPSSLVNSRATLDADVEDYTEDDGFIPVKSKGRRRTQRSASIQSTGGGVVRATESMTKKQRQNKAKREAEKEARIEGELQRQETLAHHKKELERTRIEEMYKKGKHLSGGMTMSVGSSGKAEWD